MVALLGETLSDMLSYNLVEIRCYLQLAFGSGTQALNPIMGCFDLDKLTENNLVS